MLGKILCMCSCFFLQYYWSDYIFSKNACKNTNNMDNVHVTPCVISFSVIIEILLMYLLYRTEKILNDSAVSVAPPARPVRKVSAPGAALTKPSTRQRVAEVIDKDDEEGEDEDGEGDDDDGGENDEEEEEEEEGNGEEGKMEGIPEESTAEVTAGM